MKRGLLLVLSSAAAAAAMVLACSSGSSSTFGSGGPDTGVGDGSPGFFPDANGSGDGDGGGPASCDPSIPATFTPTWTAPNKQSVCGSSDLTDYFNQCLAATATDATCATFQSAHPTCYACIETADNSGPVQWLDGPGQPKVHYGANVAGCISIELNDPSSQGCGAAFNASVQCDRQSCATCYQTGGTTSQFAACEQAVKQQGICKSYESAQSTSCTDAGTTVNPCFKDHATPEPDDVYFPRLEGIFCGGLDGG